MAIDLELEILRLSVAVLEVAKAKVWLLLRASKNWSFRELHVVLFKGSHGDLKSFQHTYPVGIQRRYLIIPQVLNQKDTKKYPKVLQNTTTAASSAPSTPPPLRHPVFGRVGTGISGGCFGPTVCSYLSI